jgi:hypothetical protein
MRTVEMSPATFFAHVLTFRRRPRYIMEKVNSYAWAYLAPGRFVDDAWYASYGT